MESIPFKQRILRFKAYFKQHDCNVEHEATTTIVDILLQDNHSESNIKTLVDTFNKANKAAHQGSGWFDLRFHIREFLGDQNIEFIEEDGSLVLK